MPLFILLLVLPLSELYLLFEIGKKIGFWPTLGMVIGTAMLGAALARSQGLRAISEIKNEAARGEVPIALFEGLFILIAGCFLLTPGFITDGIGFILLIPTFRQWAIKKMKNRILASTLGGSGVFFRSTAFRSPNKKNADKGGIEGKARVESRREL